MLAKMALQMATTQIIRFEFWNCARVWELNSKTPLTIKNTHMHIAQGH